jgi:hypothetical protein
MRLTIQHHGTLVILRPDAQEAIDWLEEHLDPDGPRPRSAPRPGTRPGRRWGRAAEPRYVPGIVDGFERAGGTVSRAALIRPRRQWLEPGVCPQCDQGRADQFGPMHDASARCPCAGTAHCTCDTCF